MEAPACMRSNCNALYNGSLILCSYALHNGANIAVRSIKVVLAMVYSLVRYWVASRYAMLCKVLYIYQVL